MISGEDLLCTLSRNSEVYVIYILKSIVCETNEQEAKRHAHICYQVTLQCGISQYSQLTCDTQCLVGKSFTGSEVSTHTLNACK